MGLKVLAGGGVVWRRGDEDIEVLVIHRPRYRDWSFPKGKAKEGEREEDAAVREVAEEVGLTCELGPELASTSYRDAKGRKKTVRYWAMALPDGSEPIAGDGVDDWRWLPPDQAARELTWERDLDVLSSLPIDELA
jgi:8-oxo-dGTP diphosphatase